MSREEDDIIEEEEEQPKRDLKPSGVVKLTQSEIDYITNLIKAGLTLPEIGQEILRRTRRRKVRTGQEIVREKVVERMIHSLPFVSLNITHKIDDKLTINVGIEEPTSAKNYAAAHKELLPKLLESLEHLIDILREQ